MDPLSHWRFFNDLTPLQRHAIERDYDGFYQGSFTVLVIITLFDSLAIWNALEVFVLVFMTFKSYRGTYFWSLLAAAFGIIPHAISNIIHNLQIVNGKAAVEGAVTMAIVGWWFTVTGELFVLWSRLGLLVHGAGGDKLRRWTLVMIIVGSIVLYTPTSVLAWGANINTNPIFVRGYAVMEKIQLSGFFLQELILSTIYIVQAIRFLRTSISPHARSIMYQLFVVNIILIGFDLAILIMEAINLFVMQTCLKPFFYSVKLLLEFAILSRLVEVVGRPVGSASPNNTSRRSSTIAFANDCDRDKSRRTSRSWSRKPTNGRVEEEDISDFVDVEKIVGDFTHAVSLANPMPGQRKILLHDGLTVSDSDLVAPRPGVRFLETTLPAKGAVSDAHISCEG